MSRCRLHPFGAHALLDTAGALVLARLGDGTEAARWPRPPLSPARKHEDAERDADEETDEEESAHFERSVCQFVVDARTSRVALLWQEGFVDFDSDGEPDITAEGFSEIEIFDAISKESLAVHEPASNMELLLGFAPRGDLLADGKTTGLAAFFADHPKSLHGEGASGTEKLAPTKSRWDGRLRFALGFHALPHPMLLAFSEDGRRALSGSWSGYKAHLALLHLAGGPPRVLAAHAIEVSKIVVRPGFGEAIVLEANHSGPYRVAVWTTEPLERAWDVHVEPNDSILISKIWSDPTASHVLVLSTDGKMTFADLGTRVTRRFRVRPVLERTDLRQDDLDVNYQAGLIASVAAGGVSLFDFAGNLRGEFAISAQGVMAHGESFAFWHESGIDAVDAQGKWAPLWKGTVSAWASTEHGLAIADGDGRIHIVRGQ